VQTQQRLHGTDAAVIGAYAQSDLGRATLRRELVEGAQIEAGQQVLLLCETRPPGGNEAIVQTIAALVRELGAHVVLMRVDELIPVRPGSAPGAWSHVEAFRLPHAVHAAILAADVVLDYTVNSRGGQKYNVEFYTLGMYYGKRICAHRAVEAPEVLGTRAEAPIASPDALTFPSDLLRLICDRVNAILIAAAETRQQFRLTNPWGTDLRFTVLPGDVSQPGGGIRRYPEHGAFGFAGDDNRRLWDGLVGFGVTQTCVGEWVTKHCSLLGGPLSEPLTAVIRDGFLVDARGGPEAPRLLAAIADEPSGIHAILMGTNPKATPFRDGQFLLDNNGAGVGVSHVAFGGPGLFFRNGAWGPVGNKHFQLGDIPKISLWAGDALVVQDGRLLALADPVVRDAARAHGDPDALLEQFAWPDDDAIRAIA
jgi:hypothetical protein